MPNVAKVGVSNAGGGIITGPGITNVLVNYSPISIIGDIVATHGESPHTTPAIITGSKSVLAGYVPIALEGTSVATCGHPVAAGEPSVRAT